MNGMQGLRMHDPEDLGVPSEVVDKVLEGTVTREPLVVESTPDPDGNPLLRLLTGLQPRGE